MPITEAQVKLHVEPLTVGIVGAACSIFHPPLGMFILIAGICSGVDVGALTYYRKSIARAARDAMLEQRYLAEDLKGEKWGD